MMAVMPVREVGQCRGTEKVEIYTVAVRHPKPLSTRCGECLTRLGTLIAPFYRPFIPCLNLVCILFFIGIMTSIFWIFFLLGYCQMTPSLGMSDVRIIDLVVYQNDAMATTDTPWLVNSDVNITLSAWNSNTVAGCYATYRRMNVRVEYAGESILQQQVPLGFGLKPRRSRPVEVLVKGERAPLGREAGSLLEAELRNASGVVNLQFFFDVRFLRNDRKAGWLHLVCNASASSPTKDSRGVSGALVRC